MNIEELEAIIEKYDSKELWVNSFTLTPGGPVRDVIPDASSAARRKLVLSALAEIEKIISGEVKE